jgi:hypothetical protein
VVVVEVPMDDAQKKTVHLKSSCVKGLTPYKISGGAKMWLDL